MKNLLNCQCAERWAGYAPTVLRVVTGIIFALHGWQKLADMGLEGTAGMLATLGFPLATTFAVLLIIAELVGGIFLILGVFTHWSAKILGVVAVVALFSVHFSNGFFISEGGYEYILLLLAATVSIMLSGPGKLALDVRFGRSAQ